MKITVVGGGVVGARAAQLLHDVDITVDVIESVDNVTASDVAILAYGGDQSLGAAELMDRGIGVVSTSDDLRIVEKLLALHRESIAAGVPLVVGATAAPGLSGLLARHLASGFDSADEIHVATHGTGGPSCARLHHKSLGGTALGLQDGEWIKRPAGSGRELCWFPEPIGARDCYRADLADPVLLHMVFPDIQRISERRSATRRDRLTARLPMLAPPHAEGGVGGVRVEVRGIKDGVRVVEILGVAEKLGTIAGVVAAAFAAALGQGRLGQEGLVIAGAAGLPTATLLRAIMEAGIKVSAFTGSDSYP